MYSSDHIEELKYRRVYFQCIGEQYLSAQVESEGDSTTCSYCGEGGNAITLADLSDRIESAFQDHYKRTADQPNAWRQSAYLRAPAGHFRGQSRALPG